MCVGAGYFGDLDQAGLRMPANAAEIAVALGLPPVRPVAGLYGALLRYGHRLAQEAVGLRYLLGNDDWRSM